MNKDYTDITIVLDKSGSMEDIRNDIIGTFNTFFEAQKKEPGELKVTFYQFSYPYSIEKLYEQKSVKEVEDLSERTYAPTGGTALLDCIGTAINETGHRLSLMKEEERPAKVLQVIITDGEENSSEKFTRDQIFEMIKHQQDNYSWIFVFLAANQDAMQVGTSYGIRANNTMSFAATSVGTTLFTKSLSRNVSKYRASFDEADDLLSQDFFSSDDKKAQEEEIQKSKK